jgi:hypothetical protein
MKRRLFITIIEELRGTDLLVFQINFEPVTSPTPSVLIAYKVGRSYPLLTKTIPSLKTGLGTTE